MRQWNKQRRTIVRPHSCLSLNGSGYASHADDDALDMGVGDFAIGVWVKPSDIGIIIAKDALGILWGLRAHTNNSINLVLAPSGGSTYQVNSANNVWSGQWIYVFASVDRNGNAQIYIDGQASGSAVNVSADDGKTLSNNSELRLGYSSGFVAANYFDGQLALLEQFPFGYSGLPTASGATPADYAAWRHANPFADFASKFANGAWAGYADAVYTDTHNGAGAVTGLVVGNWYEFTQGTVGHDLDYGGGTLTTTGVFEATQATGTISSGDGSDHVRRTGIRGGWRLDGDYTDDTSNGLNLTEGGSGNMWELCNIPLV